MWASRKSTNKVEEDQRVRKQKGENKNMYNIMQLQIGQQLGYKTKSERAIRYFGTNFEQNVKKVTSQFGTLEFVCFNECLGESN